MEYNSIFARSFSSHDKKKLGYCGAFVGCFVIAFTICTLLKPYLDPLPLLNLRVSAGAGLKIIMTDQETSQLHQIDIQTKEIKPICETSEPLSDICEMTGDIRIHGNSSTVFVIMNTTTSNKNTTSWRIRPYARKGDMIAMGVVQEFTIKLIAEAAATSNQLQEIPTCAHHRSVPGLVFSTSGFIGNLFHDFTDVLIPLFLTSREFDGQVKFLVTNKQSWWINKYKQVLRKLSNYEVIDIDREPGVHCFPRMVVGLKHLKEFSIEPLRSPYSMKDFREFLRGAYSLEREEGVIIRDGAAGKRPRLLIISRKRTRLLLNEGEIVKMAIGLGFEVVLTDADVNTNLTRFANLVNSCDVMMGVHGAGLTNMVFLPENAIVIQILPLGGMEFLARLDFGDPAQDMNLRYLEYQIGEEESSLRQEYPAGHQVFTDPDSIMKKGWLPFQVVYLDKQNVTLDVGRFRATLLEALNLLH